VSTAPAFAQGVTFEGGPQDPTPTNDPTPTFSFSTTDLAAVLECALDGTAPAPCSSPHTTGVLTDGPHRLEVRAGEAGEWAPRDFTIDTTPPETVLVRSPEAKTTERAPRFEFAADEAGGSFECSVDQGAFGSCGSPWSPGELGLGRHLVAVRALDALGNRDASPAVAVFTVGDPRVSSSSGGQTATATITAGVRVLAKALAENVDGLVRTLATTETPTILGSGQVGVSGMRALVPGTLAVAAFPQSGGPAVLTGTLSAAAGATGTLILRPTESGRPMLRRNASLPVLLTARFTSRGLSMSSSRRLRLVRDWLTPGESRRAVGRELRRRPGPAPRRLTLAVQNRCGSGCLDIRATWLRRGRRVGASGRVRQLNGRLSATITAPVRQAR
jgi:hypothetical protein